jgi:hypothetical protein
MVDSQEKEGSPAGMHEIEGRQEDRKGKHSGKTRKSIEPGKECNKLGSSCRTDCEIRQKNHKVRPKGTKNRQDILQR